MADSITDYFNTFRTQPAPVTRVNPGIPPVQQPPVQQPPVQQPQVSPPANPQEYAQRKKGWSNVLTRFQEDPVLQRAVMMFGAQLMQPLQRGQTPVGQIGMGLARAANQLTAGRRQQQPTVKFPGNVPVRTTGDKIELMDDAGKWVPYSNKFYNKLAEERKGEKAAQYIGGLNTWTRENDAGGMDIFVGGDQWEPATPEALEALKKEKPTIREDGKHFLMLTEDEEGEYAWERMKDAEGNLITKKSINNWMPRFFAQQEANRVAADLRFERQMEVMGVRQTEAERVRGEKRRITEEQNIKKLKIQEIADDESTVGAIRTLMNMSPYDATPALVGKAMRGLKNKKFQTKQNLLSQEFFQEPPLIKAKVYTKGEPWQASDGNSYLLKKGKFVKID